MTKILVSGLINIETTLRIESFPLNYFPVCYPFHGVNSSVSGVGYNIAKALTTLGNRAPLLSLIGQDIAANQVRAALQADNLPIEYVLPNLAHTPQSVILYEPSGRRQIHVDLKDIQNTPYPETLYDQAAQDCQLCALCNINFSRSLLQRARAAGKWVATDVHAISTLEDDYNREFMQAAHILFISHENLPAAPEEFARAVIGRYGSSIVVIGMGGQGALLAVRDGQTTCTQHFPAITTRPVVNTIGAGDALFSAFLHIYNKTLNPYEALRQACFFASYKIGESGAAEGFLNAQGLNQILTNSALPQSPAP